MTQQHHLGCGWNGLQHFLFVILMVVIIVVVVVVVVVVVAICRQAAGMLGWWPHFRHVDRVCLCSASDAAVEAA